MRTKIINCTCRHKYQDESYGPYKRVHNLGGNKDHVKWRCTVCGSEKG